MYRSMMASFLSGLQPGDQGPWGLVGVDWADFGCLVGVDRGFLGDDLALDFVGGEGEGA
jgi:hypothetical protein